MAIKAIQGLMGAGKSNVAVNVWMREALVETNRHIYTNLPLKRVDESDPESDYVLVRQITGNLARRAALMARIHKLVPKMMIPRGEDGKPVSYLPLGDDDLPIEGAERIELGPKHGVREFWYFTRPNAYVFLDEVADIWPTEERQKRPPDMKSYIRHHRHYKDDLFFMFQEAKDIDPDLRGKIQTHFFCKNSKKENMAENWMLRGLKWPVQFFMVEEYNGKSAIQATEEARQRLKKQNEVWYMAWPRTFQTYHSFSQAQSLPGKESASETANSSDFDPRLWPQVKDFVKNLGPLASMAGMIVGMGVGGYIGLMKLLDASKQSTAVSGLSQPASVKGNGSDQAKAPPGTRLVELGINGEFQAVKTNASTVQVADRETLLMATARFVRTNKRLYAKGDPIGGGKLETVLLDGVVLDDGTSRSWAVLFPGERINAR